MVTIYKLNLKKRVRKLITNSQFYFSKSGSDRVDYVSKEDLDGLFVFDYLHTDDIKI